MGTAIFVVESYVESPFWTQYTLRILSGTDQKGAFLHEMLQESWEMEHTISLICLVFCHMWE